MPPGWPDFASGDEERLLAPFLACASPADFVALQRRVDMARLVEALDDWSAVRLGALGPLRAEASSVLTRKRAAFLLRAAEKYGLPRAEVFALFILHSAFDDEVRELLRLLARDKQLGETLGRMGAVREELARRGMRLANFPDREERPGDVLRGLGRAARDVLSSTPMSDGARYQDFSSKQKQLPPPHQQALEEVEQALIAATWRPGNVMLAGFDSLTLACPDVVEGKRRRKYSRAAIWKGLEESRDEHGTSVGLYRTMLPALDMTLRLWRLPSPTLDIWIEVQPLSAFADVERCRQFVDMVRAWASRYPVDSFVSAHSAADRELADSPNFGRDDETARRDGYDKVYEVCWLNIFGPKMVEAVGRERMLSTPAYRVEELPNGAVLLVTWPTAAGFATEQARVAQARAHVHLRPELDFDTVLNTLRGRSAALVPLELRFHSDVAPLLSRVVDRSSIGQRQRRIAEFNAYQPPEPEEWLPAESALPSNVEDPDGVREYYSHLAEHLVALMHTHVPSVFKETPESLTDVDYRLWFENFPEVFERDKVDELVVPAVGAYLGEVLVRNLGGQWLPRKKLGEAQVLVGDRAWLPMLRAHRYMRSRQSLLDYSLTQLYRVAERHRA